MPVKYIIIDDARDLIKKRRLEHQEREGLGIIK